MSGSMFNSPRTARVFFHSMSRGKWLESSEGRALSLPTSLTIYKNFRNTFKWCRKHYAFSSIKSGCWWLQPIWITLFSGLTEKVWWRAFKFLVSNFMEAEKALLFFDARIVTYWVNKILIFSRLSRIALRVLAMPASASFSKRDFRVLKTILPSRRASLKDENIDEVLLLRPFLTKQ